MTYLIDSTSNLYKTKVTVRTHKPEVTYFISTTDESRIALISSSSNVPEDNIFYIGTTTSNKDAYIAIDKNYAVSKIASFGLNKAEINTDLRIKGDLLPVGESSLGSAENKWKNLELRGGLYFDKAMIAYENNELSFMNQSNYISVTSNNVQLPVSKSVSIASKSSNIYVSIDNMIVQVINVTTSNESEKAALLVNGDGESRSLVISDVVTTSNYIVTSNVLYVERSSNVARVYAGLKAKHLSIESDDHCRTTLIRNENGTFLTSYGADAGIISSLDLTRLSTSDVREGVSNLYYTDERCREVIQGLAIQSQTNIAGTSNEIIGVITSNSDFLLKEIGRMAVDINSNIGVYRIGINSNLGVDYNRAMRIIGDTSNQLRKDIISKFGGFPKIIVDNDIDSSNYLRNASNVVRQTLQDTSNDVVSYLVTTDSHMSNYIRDASNVVVKELRDTSNFITGIINDGDSNIRKYINKGWDDLNEFLTGTSNIMATSIGVVDKMVREFSESSCNILIREILKVVGDVEGGINVKYGGVLGYLGESSNTLSSNVKEIEKDVGKRIGGLTLDDIGDGVSKRFITSNIYDGDLTVSNMSIMGNVVPDRDNVFSIGTNDKRWRDAYFSGNTIYLGDAKISAGIGGLEIKDGNNQYIDVAVSKILIKDVYNDGYTVLESVGNEVKIGAISGDATPIDVIVKTYYTTDIMKGTSNLYFTFEMAGELAAASNLEVFGYIRETSNQLSNKISRLTTDQIKQGTSNRFIVNGVYDGDLAIGATLTVSNLEVTGNSTVINTNEYMTETLKINTSAIDGPALKVVKSGDGNIAEFYYNVNPVMMIGTNGRVAVGKSSADENLDIQGNMKFSSSINNISAVEFGYLTGVNSGIQGQINEVVSGTSNYTSNIGAFFLKNYRDSSNSFVNTIDGLNVNMIKYIDNTSNTFSSNMQNTSNDIIGYLGRQSLMMTSNLMLNVSNVLNTRMTDVADVINLRVNNLETNLNSYIRNTSNRLEDNVRNTSNVLSGRINNILSTGWTVGNGDVYFMNKVGVGTNSLGTEILTVNGNIKFSGSINGVSAVEFGYLSGAASNIQQQLNVVNSNLFAYTSNTSNSFVRVIGDTSNVISAMVNRINNNVVSGMLQGMSNEFMTNLRTTSNNISSSISAKISSTFVPSQWSNVGTDIYYLRGNVGIGTNVVGLNELEVYGDMMINEGNLKKTVKDGVTVNYQIERWKDSPTYDNTDGNKYIYYTDGYVGIQKTVPEANLHVGAASCNFTGSMVYFNQGMAGTGSISTLNNICSIFDSSLWCKSTIASTSDSRIKKNIADIDDDSALAKIMSIEPKTYEYIDPLKGTERVYGFIAQQIREVIPEAVALRKEVVPNIFRVCKVGIVDKDKIIFDEAIGNDLYIGCNVSIITEDGINDMYKVVEIGDNYIVIDRWISGDKVFVYGIEVDDFHTLDKSYIFTLNVCATQTLSREVDKITERVRAIEIQLGVGENDYLEWSQNGVL